MTTPSRFRTYAAAVVLAMVIVSSAPAKYSGGTGEPNDPYQIATAADLIALGETPEDYDKHFILTADIDLDPNLPGGKVFDKAVVQYFSGVFVGNGHVISHLRVLGGSYLGLFGQLSGKVRSFGLAEVSIHGSGDYVGALAGTNDGYVTQCYSTGAVSGNNRVGGLVGSNETEGSLANCWSMGLVRGVCLYPMSWYLGNGVGGLAGTNWGTIESCYSAAATSGNQEYVGGLVGENVDYVMIDGSEVKGHVDACFRDTEASSQVASDSGMGKTTFEMQMASTFLEAGWDFLGEIENGLHEVWKMPEGGGYPVLAIFDGYTPPVLQGLGTPEYPYLVSNATELGAVIHYNASAHYHLGASIDLSGTRWGTAVIPWFRGTFDGDNHSISHLTVSGVNYAGMFGRLESGAEIRSLGVVDVNIAGSYEYAGGLVGYSEYSTVTQCYSAGIVRGGDYVGGLMGWNGSGEVRYSYSTATVIGNDFVAGLVGVNSSLLGPGACMTHCYSTGLVGSINTGPWRRGEEPSVNGLVSSHNDHYRGSVNACFWDIETSGQVTSDGGVGLTTVEMQMAATFLDAGWDFVDETTNGTEDIWKIAEGSGYPRLAWQKYSGGTGEWNDPYQIATAADLIALGETPDDYHKGFILTADIDLDPNLPGRKVFDRAVIAPDTNDANWEFDGTPFIGVFDGDGHIILHLPITGGEYLGLFGQIGYEATVSNLGLEAVKVSGTGPDVGGLAGENRGSIATSYSSGSVTGKDEVGGLVGNNEGSIVTSYSNSSVNGRYSVGGLVGRRYYGRLTRSYSAGAVSGEGNVGGLVGINWGSITSSYSTGSVTGNGDYVGGLVGFHHYSGAGPGEGFASRSCFWDVQTSGQTESAWGEGKTTSEMQDPNTFMAAGWEFYPHNIWLEPEGVGYPILWWQQSPLPELPTFAGGSGERSDPYLIATGEDLNSIGHNPRLMTGHFRLVADLEFADLPSYEIGDHDYPFEGVFDGNDKTLQDITRPLFGYVTGTLKDLRVVDPNCSGSPVRYNYGTIVDCHVLGGTISGYSNSGYPVGGLVADNYGNIANCYSDTMVVGEGSTGGLVGSNYGNVANSFSSGLVVGTGQNGNVHVGGLAASNRGRITDSYSTGTVSGSGPWYAAGGLVGWNVDGSIVRSYAVGMVTGENAVGGLVGSNYSGTISASVWDVETSGVLKSSGGVGLTTAEMMDSCMLGLNGFANDPNWALDAGRDYPHLAWEDTRGDIIPEPDIDWLDGQGTEDKPFRISTAEQLILIGKASIFWDKYLILGADIDLDPALPGRRVFGQALIQTFKGIFDGNGHTISHLTITGEDYLGLFGQLESPGEVKNLAMRDVSIAGTGYFVGGLLGSNRGRATQCYSTGSISGDWNVGGLVGWNYGSIATSYSSSSVRGSQNVGGLAGGNGGAVSECYSTGAATGSGWWSGGLLGRDASGTVTSAFWDTQTSGQTQSAGGTGLTTTEMQDIDTFLDAGWDFVGETANGTDDIWWILEGKDYPRLWWELNEEVTVNP